MQRLLCNNNNNENMTGEKYRGNRYHPLAGSPWSGIGGLPDCLWPALLPVLSAVPASQECSASNLLPGLLAEHFSLKSADRDLFPQECSPSTPPQRVLAEHPSHRTACRALLPKECSSSTLTTRVLAVHALDIHPDDLAASNTICD